MTDRLQQVTNVTVAERSGTLPKKKYLGKRSSRPRNPIGSAHVPIRREDSKITLSQKNQNYATESYPNDRTPPYIREKISTVHFRLIFCIQGGGGGCDNPTNPTPIRAKRSDPKCFVSVSFDRSYYIRIHLNAIF